MNALTAYLEKMGSNFLVSSMIPSLAFIIAGLFVFDPLFDTALRFTAQDGLYSLIGFGLLLTVLTVILGYTLTALNTYIIKLFEGYVFLPRFGFLREKQARAARSLLLQREFLKKRIATIEKRSIKHGGRLDGVLERLRRRYFITAEKYDSSFPPSPEDVLPTQFGNVLRASESYPMSRYGLDGVAFWPRLHKVVSLTYQTSIDTSRNELSFLVNISFLSMLFFFCSALAIITSPLFVSTTLEDYLINFPLRFGGAGFLALFISVIFYRASLYSVGDFGNMIRSAYDLFRFDLLEQFHLKLPENSVEEYLIWQNLNEFVVLGAESLEFQPLVYHHPERQKEEKKDGLIPE